MTTLLIPQEIYLLERYSSKAYYEPMRDDWERMVKHTERCVEVFVRNLPLDYRSRPLFNQLDIVWGERTLPNFRHTRDALNRGYIRLTHGDMRALGAAGRIESDFSGFSRDHSSDWMDEPQLAGLVDGGGETFWYWLTRALRRASNIERTVGAYWVQGDLTIRYHETWGPLDPPQAWPRYTVDPIGRAHV